jgi:Tfp pilus assembly protein PilO
VTDRDRKALLLMVLVCVPAIAYMLFSPKGGGKQAQLTAEDARKQRKIVMGKIENLNKELDALEAANTRLTYDIPPDEIVPRVLRQLQQIAQQAKVRLREVKPLRPIELKSGQGQKVPLEVRFRAPFQPNAMQFLYAVEDPKYKMVVDKINIASAEGRLKAVDMTATITVFTRAAYVANSSQGDTANAR